MTNLTELLSETLEIDVSEISLDMDYKSHPKWDSLAALSLITAIEDDFGLVLNDSDLKKLVSVQDLSDHIMSHAKK